MNPGEYARLVPKAELHVHFEGTIGPSTLLTLARRNGVHLPARTIAEVREWMRFRDFQSFCTVFMTAARCAKSADDYALITRELGAALLDQNVQYAEVTFSPSMHRYAFGIPHDTYFAGLTEGRRYVRERFGVTINWIFDIERDLSDPIERQRRATFTTSVAIEGQEDGVVALGLGGNEVGSPPAQFAPWFERALAAGLHSAPHAGEGAGPRSIWGALEALGAERIGHGVRAVEDQALVAHLAERRIALDVCPTSNIRLGIYADYAVHPLPLLHAASVPITVNSDDPALFSTTLLEQVSLLHDSFGFEQASIDEILLNGIRYSFLAGPQKREMEVSFRAKMATAHRRVGQHRS